MFIIYIIMLYFNLYTQLYYTFKIFENDIISHFEENVNIHYTVKYILIIIFML